MKTPLQQIESLVPALSQLFSVLIPELPSMPGDDQTDFPATTPVRIGFRPAVGRWDKPEWIYRINGTPGELSAFPFQSVAELSRLSDPHQIAEAVAADLAQQIGGGL